MVLIKELGPYSIVRRIGKGGMGEVYLAQDSRKAATDPAHQVALKVMWHDSEKDSPGVLTAERQGAQLQARLYAIDQRVACVYDFADHDDCFYIAMEYIQGQDLSELLKGGRLDPLEAARIAIEVADIIGRVHTMRFEHQSHDSRGVVHGDIKPRNIRIEPSGRVRLLDFGIAKALSMTRHLTRNEFGSTGYASPERLNSGQVDEHSDLWSLAIVLYEMLTGQTPFVGENTRKLEQLIVGRAPMPPLPSAVPSPIKQVVMKALNPRLDQRYPNALVFKKALKEAVGQCQSEADAFATRRTVKVDAASPPPVMTPPSGSAAAGHDDPNATRRTVPPAEDHDSNATRRTVSPAEPGVSGSAPTLRLSEEMPVAQLDAPAGLPPLPPVPPPNGLPTRRASLIGQGVMALFVVGGLGGAGLAANEVMLGRETSTLVANLRSRQVTCDEAWQTRETLRSRSVLGMGISGLSNPLYEQCKTELELTISRYRAEDLKLVKKDWEQARVVAQHALALYSTSEMQARLEYVQGHLDRIGERFDQARAHYDQAAAKDTTFCDPYYALIHMYAYNQKDLDNLERALTEAGNRHCQLERKQALMLADARREHADLLFKEAKKEPVPDQQLAQLTEVKRRYVEAQTTYQQYKTVGQAGKHLKSIEKNLREIALLENELSAPAETPEPTPEKFLRQLFPGLKINLD